MWIRIALVVVALSALAHANPAAEKVYRDGKALFAAGKLDEACDAFRRSQELEARVGTLLNLGECEEKRGKIASAWVAFADARGLATRMNDPRVGYADQRAAALAPRLSYLTLNIPASGRPAGFVVRRNGGDVLIAELNLEVPVDPGHYELEAAAPGFFAWKHALDLTVGQHATFDIPALTVDPSAPVPDAGVFVDRVPPPLASRRFGVGLAFGVSSDSDLLYGLRVPFHLLDVGAATLRAVPSVYYSHIVDDEDVYHNFELFRTGFAVEYARPLAPQILVAAGLGVGFDVEHNNYGTGSGVTMNGWGAARLSPTLRLARSIDLCLHLQVVATSDNVVGLGSLGVDYFFW